MSDFKNLSADVTFLHLTDLISRLNNNVHKVFDDPILFFDCMDLLNEIYDKLLELLKEVRNK